MQGTRESVLRAGVLGWGGNPGGGGWGALLGPGCSGGLQSAVWECHFSPAPNYLSPPPPHAVLEKGTAPAGNLAAEILPAELRWVQGGVPNPGALPRSPDPPGPPRETVARLQQENRRLQAQEVTLRLQRDQLQQQLHDADRQRWGQGGSWCPELPPRLPRIPNTPPTLRLESTGVAELRTVLGDQGDPTEEVSGVWGCGLPGGIGHLGR